MTGWSTASGSASSRRSSPTTPTRERRLRLELPDGRVVDGRDPARRPGRRPTSSRAAVGRVGRGPVVGGAQRAASTSRCGSSRRPAQPTGVDRGAGGAVSLISRASLARLAQAAGGVDRSTPAVPDADRDRRRRRPTRRTRWVGRAVRIGEAVVSFGGHVGRCLITSRDPDTGEVDLPTLDMLGAYRGELDTTEPLPFGIWGRVVTPEAVRVGDEVTPPIVFGGDDRGPRQRERRDPGARRDRDRRPRRGRHAGPAREAQRARRRDVRGDHRRRRAPGGRAGGPRGRAARRRAELLLRPRRRRRDGQPAGVRRSDGAAARPVPNLFQRAAYAGSSFRCR